MNTVKDFTIGQRIATQDGNGEVTKVGRKYVYVQIDGDTAKPQPFMPEDLSEIVEPVEAPTAPAVVDYLALMSTTTAPSPVSNVVMVEDEVHAMMAGPLSNATPLGGRPPMRLKGKRADADNRRAARKAQRKSRRANRR